MIACVFPPLFQKQPPKTPAMVAGLNVKGRDFHKGTKGNNP